MENVIQVFTHEKFGSLRTLLNADAPWFAGKDVASAVGFKDTDKAIRNHVDPRDKMLVKAAIYGGLENGTLQNGGMKFSNRGLIFINESGVYSLILSSKLPLAQEFRHWLTSQVIPSIFSVGYYANGEAVDKIALLEAENTALKEEIIALKEEIATFKAGIVESKLVVTDELSKGAKEKIDYLLRAAELTNIDRLRNYFLRRMDALI